EGQRCESREQQCRQTFHHSPSSLADISELIPSSRRGVAAPVIKCREATEAAQTGRSLTRHISCERPPRPLHLRRLRDILLMSRPPLLSRRGLRLPVWLRAKGRAVSLWLLTYVTLFTNCCLKLKLHLRADLNTARCVDCVRNEPIVRADCAVGCIDP